jgi:hypothetical protein
MTDAPKRSSREAKKMVPRRSGKCRDSKEAVGMISQQRDQEINKKRKMAD